MVINHTVIREACQKKAYSQEYVAYILGVSQAQYSRLENGSMVFRVDTLGELLKILEANPLEIITFDNDQIELITQTLSIENIVDEGNKLNLKPITDEEMKNINGGSRWYNCIERLCFH